MKKKGDIFVFVMAFLLGMLVCFFCFFNKNNEKKNNEDLVLNILKTENNNLSFKAGKLLRLFVRNDIDTTSRLFLLWNDIDTTTAHQFFILKKMDLISNYFNTILSSPKEYDFFSIDTIKSILTDSLIYVYLDDFYEKAEKISINNNTLIEKEWYINVCFNIILNRCFETYKEKSLMTAFGWEDCVFVPKKDTVKIGDFYEADIYFSVKDLSQTYTIEFEDGTIFKGDVYKEKATKKGLNTRTGYLVFFNGETTTGFPFEFSYYVK